MIIDVFTIAGLVAAIAVIGLLYILRRPQGYKVRN